MLKTTDPLLMSEVRNYELLLIYELKKKEFSVYFLNPYNRT